MKVLDVIATLIIGMTSILVAQEWHSPTPFLLMIVFVSGICCSYMFDCLISD